MQLTTPTTAFAQSAGNGPAAIRTEPGAVGKEYLRTVQGMRLQTPIAYLAPDANLDLAQEAAEQSPDAQSFGTPNPIKWGATGVIIVAVLLLALLFWLARGQLADLRRTRNRRFGEEAGMAFDSPAAELDHDLIARLRREQDPRRGLRQVLERFLRIAAADNAIVLKRSLTTRELVQRLPGSWSHRAELETLARQTELVLFGGREIGEADYQRCLDLAEPFLRRAPT